MNQRNLPGTEEVFCFLNSSIREKQKIPPYRCPNYESSVREGRVCVAGFKLNKPSTGNKHEVVLRNKECFEEAERRANK